jgi:hypothetical protein
MDQRLELREERLRLAALQRELHRGELGAQAVDLSSLVLRSSSGS